MSCGYSRQEIEKIVVDVYRGIMDDTTITKDSRFGIGKEIEIDDYARRLFFFPLKQSVDKVPDCIIKKLTPDKCQRAKTVGEIINEICKEFKIQ